MFLYTSDNSAQEQQTPFQEPSVFTSFPEHSNSKTRNFQTILEQNRNPGLKELSKIVYTIIQSQKQTNIQLILSEIKKNYPFCTNTINQQRRIYDCLNVMVTLGIIQKQHKTYSFEEYPVLYPNILQGELEDIKILRMQNEKNLMNKRKLFSHLTKQHQKLDQLVNRNKDNFEYENQQIYPFPFLVLKSMLDKQIEISLSQQEVLIESNNPIQIVSDLDIIIELDFND